MNEPQYLPDILILLAAAVVAVSVFQRLGLGSVLGYLAAGAVVGPWGFSFIDQIDEIRHIAEFGVVFLLFIIGIELKPARLWAMRRLVFGLGTAQVILTGLVIAGLALLFDQPPKLAVIIGFGLALSSTAFGLQILTERGELQTGHGQTAFSILLLQDLAVVPLLTLVSLLAADTALLEGIEFAILEAGLAIAAVIVAARYFLSPFLRLVATSRTAEVFTAAVVFAVLGTAWMMEEVGLSLALGAFLAGLMMAESHYRHQVVADIEPFRGILLGLFFMGVGMSIDFSLLAGQAWLIVALVAGLLLIKSVIIWALCRVMGIGAANATRASMLLSQSGEFGFVLFGLATIRGLMPQDLFLLLTLLIALTMASTPLMARLGDYLGGRLRIPATGHAVQADGFEHGEPRVLIAGFGRVGRRVAKLLDDGQVTYLAIESNPERVLKGRQDGFSVFFGDASRADVLRAAGAGQTDALICTLDRPMPAVRLIKILRRQYPDIAIHARGRNRQHCDELLAAGATIAISETLEASLQLAEAGLKTVGVVEQDAAALVASMRKKYYE